jgi:hypothetical protein
VKAPLGLKDDETVAYLRDLPRPGAYEPPPRKPTTAYLLNLWAWYAVMAVGVVAFWVGVAWVAAAAYHSLAG